MFFLEFVIGGTRIRITAIPELLYKAFPFFVVSQVIEKPSLFFRNNVRNIIVEPIPVIP